MPMALMATGAAAIALGLFVFKISLSSFHEIIAALCVGQGLIVIALGYLASLLAAMRDDARAWRVRDELAGRGARGE